MSFIRVNGRLVEVSDAQLAQMFLGQLEAESHLLIRMEKPVEPLLVPNEQDFIEKPEPRKQTKPPVKLMQPGEGLPL